MGFGFCGRDDDYLCLTPLPLVCGLDLYAFERVVEVFQALV